METKEFLLALDCSSVELGYSIWNIETKELISLGHYTFQEGKLLEKGTQYENFLRDLMNKFHITEMVIEECYEAMFGGMSSSHTIAVLNQHNAMIQWITYSLGIEVNNITVAKSRKSAFPNVVLRPKKFSGGLSHKEIIFNAVLEKIGPEHFPTKLVTRGKNKGEVVFESWCLDISDSYVIGLGYLNLCEKELKK